MKGSTMKVVIGPLHPPISTYILNKDMNKHLKHEHKALIKIDQQKWEKNSSKVWKTEEKNHLFS